MMDQAIKDFAKQFTFEPKIENENVFELKDKFILCGMGGSHLAGGILRTVKPEQVLLIHRGYGLPDLPDDELLSRLLILSSYSGNTEEVLDGFSKGLEKHCSMLVITTGGQLLELAKQHQVPYIQLPATGVQPRSALGFSFLALLRGTGDEQLLTSAQELSEILKPEDLMEEGKKLAESLRGKVPIIYSSTRNFSLAYNWKIKFNETGKIPAFYNVFPELNHNEMTGFDVKEQSRSLSEKFSFIILQDPVDHPKVLKRFEVLTKLLRDRGFPVQAIEVVGTTPLEKVFSNLLLADWVALHTAKNYSLESEQVPMVEEFKKLIS